MTPVKGLRHCLFFKSSAKFLCRKMASNAEYNDVLYNAQNSRGGFITLNRPKALNSLNLQMVECISSKLTACEKEREFIIVQGHGRAFCAGGDIVAVTRGGPTDTCLGEQFFKTEYQMNYQISQLRIPYIALIDGITMGGGVGLSVHGKYRIATENTLFAMPETQIGLFPDVGGSYFLSRLGPLGMYLALTGFRLQGMDVAKAGIATHFMESKKLPELMQDVENNMSCKNVDEVLAKHAKCLKSNEFSLSSKMDLIQSVFSKPTLEEMLEALRMDGSEWSLETLKTINKMSPTSLQITVRELREGKLKTLKECLEMEYRLAVAALKAKISPDFYEGVRALLVDKDKKPVWKPPTIEAINNSLLDKVFEKLPEGEELQLPCAGQ